MSSLLGQAGNGLGTLEHIVEGRLELAQIRDVGRSEIDHDVG